MLKNTMYLIVVAKQLGTWINNGDCVATGNDSSCGPGNQRQTRTCTDGTIDKCAASDVIEKTISCSDAGTALPDCDKHLGGWINDGSCVATGADASCGPGNQRQTRTCADGTTDKCTASDVTEKTISCSDAETALPDCDKQFGGWINNGSCVATGPDASCGPGNHRQTRTCTDGTTDKCTASDVTEQTISCSDAGAPLPECPGKAWRSIQNSVYLCSNIMLN